MARGGCRVSWGVYSRRSHAFQSGGNRLQQGKRAGGRRAEAQKAHEGASPGGAESHEDPTMGGGERGGVSLGDRGGHLARVSKGESRLWCDRDPHGWTCSGRAIVTAARKLKMTANGDTLKRAGRGIRFPRGLGAGLWRWIVPGAVLAESPYQLSEDFLPFNPPHSV